MISPPLIPQTATHGTYCPYFRHSHHPITAPQIIRVLIDPLSLDTHFRTLTVSIGLGSYSTSNLLEA